MEIAEIREKLHQMIDEMDDGKAEEIYALLTDETEEEYTDEFKAELDEIEAYYDNGGKMMSAEEVKKQIQESRHPKGIKENV